MVSTEEIVIFLAPDKFAKMLNGANNGENGNFQMITYYDSKSGEERIRVSGLGDLVEGQEYKIRVVLARQSGRERM